MPRKFANFFHSKDRKIAQDLILTSLLKKIFQNRELDLHLTFIP